MLYKTLTREIAEGWESHSSLKEYTSINDDAAEVLAKYDEADLQLPGLTSLSPGVIQALSTKKGGVLDLGGLTSLPAGFAEAFSKFNGSLGLDGLTSITEADVLAITRSVVYLGLGGIKTLTDPVAEVISKCNARVYLDGLVELTHPGLAAKLADMDHILELSELKTMSDEVANLFSKSKTDLRFSYYLNCPNFNLAWKLFLKNRNYDHLTPVVSLTDADANIISQYKNDVYFDEVPTINDSVAETLSQHKGILSFRGLTSLSDNAARSLSKHQGVLVLPPEFSKQVTNHFLCAYLGEPILSRQSTSQDGILEAIDLQQGKTYDCTLESTHGTEKSRFVQLAIDATSTKRFILANPEYVLEHNPGFVRWVSEYEYILLYLEEYGTSCEWSRYVSEVNISETGSYILLNDEDAYLHDFKEVAT